MTRIGALLLGLTMLALTAACGGPSTPVPGIQDTTCQPEGQAITLLAHNTEFDPTCLAARASKGLEVRFDNQDGGVRHSFSVYSADPGDDPNAKTLFDGRIVQGPAMVTYDVPGLAAGTYHFRCEVHPGQMSGTFVVR